MSDFLTVVKDNALAITTLVGVFTIIGTGLGFWFNFKLSRKKLESEKKALRQQMITNNIAPMRQAWINDLRLTSSQFISEAIFISAYHTYKKNKSKDENEDNDEEKKFNEMKVSIIRTTTYLDLLLPSKTEKNKEKEAQKIRKIMKELIFCNEKNMSPEEFNQKVINIKIELRSLLKKEWEVTKSLKEIE
ncbi:hypothetical protein B2H99_02270 [Morganella morganii]|uniref:hypothetical protein n=1 Tax=Morganella morganii TaxID=582 RepID=UPI0009C140F5|nr:hypothetical protein [Morganella morganii]OQP28734.1 hypothetical protein B2H99_02270 [Morganella morganii]OQP30397.1 hypothetical protein B2I00_08940 [Morganella morganii]